MVLFAEGEGAALTWIAVAMAALSTLGMVATAIIAYFSGKDKLRFDHEMSSMKLALAACQENHEECEQQRAEASVRIDKLQDRADRAERAAARLEGDNAGMSRELSDLRVDVKELRARLLGGAP